RLEADRTRMTFTYRRGGFRRGTYVDFSTAPKINGNIASYELIIPARGQWSTCLQFTPVIDATPVEPRYRCEVPVDRATPVERLAAWRRLLPIMACDHDTFGALLARSTEDLPPGRILHEMRFGEAAGISLGGGTIYYGSADATPLFVMVLGELQRWGSRRGDVDALLPAADRALEWITAYGDKDGDGYVEYERAS